MLNSVPKLQEPPPAGRAGLTIKSNKKEQMKISLYLLLFVFVGCSNKPDKKGTTTPLPESNPARPTIKYAAGFTVESQGDITVLKITNPWPSAEKEYTYALIDREKAAAITLNRDEYDAIVLTPLKRVVVTSTTHIPSLEALKVEHTLAGFPGTHYISSKKTRKLISDGKVKELGDNATINTEILIDLAPDALIGFSINNNNKVYNTIQKLNIPVIYNGDWTETSPLGKAEWVKFFGVLFDKEKEASKIFNKIEADYNEAVQIAALATEKPTVLSGAMYKDIWYLPMGDSWQAQFLKDANANYLWSETEGTGSSSLSFESVLEKGQNADIWINPGQFTSYGQIQGTNVHYTKFKAFQEKKIISSNISTGETGGVLYFELAPNRPDLVLKDLIKVLHPRLLPDYEPFFFKPLE